MPWTDSWIGLPYAIGGRGPRAFDCFGLVQALYRARHGIDLAAPEERLADHRAALAVAERDWSPVAAEDVREGDALVFRGLNPGALHVGYAVDGADMLHTGGRAGPGSPVPQASRVERWARPAWRALLVGCWRPDAV